jgi:hypothetical protein
MVININIFLINSDPVDSDALVVRSPGSTEMLTTNITEHGDLVAIIDEMESQFLETHWLSMIFAVMLISSKLATILNLHAILTFSHDVIKVINISVFGLIHSFCNFLNHGSLSIQEFRVVIQVERNLSLFLFASRGIFEIKITDGVELLLEFINRMIGFGSSRLNSDGLFGIANFFDLK